MARLDTARTSRRTSARLKNRSVSGIRTIEESQEAVIDMMNVGSSNMDICEEGDTMHVTESVLPTISSKHAEPALHKPNSSEMFSAPRDKGKGKAVEEKYFEFMELPAELRLCIYRACLTRPRKILLSKAVEVPQLSEQEQADHEESEENIMMLDGPISSQEHYQSLTATLQRLRAARGLPPRSTASSAGARAVRTGSQSRPSANLPNLIASRRRLAQAARPSSSTSPGSIATLASGSSGSSTAVSHAQLDARRTVPRRSLRGTRKATARVSGIPKGESPLIVNILRANKAVYKEARSILYSENTFDLCIDTAVSSLAALHQRSRRLIRHVELEIPSYTEIQDKFSEVVRLSLRYCSGLRKLTIHTPFCLPGGDGNATPNSNVQIWAQGFEILRWLPQQCEVVLMGHKNAEIEQVVARHLHLAKTLSPVAYAHRQLIPSDSDRSV